jgi:c-di-GMP-binding flagellar brake protein YcgR
MQSAVALNEHEQLLIQELCMRMQGPLAYSGVLTLTDQRMMFHPTGRLDRMVGVKAFTIPTAEISKTRIKGLERNLFVTVGDEEYRFAGEGARRVHTRLEALLNPHEEQNLFDRTERVLVQGAASIYPNGLISTRGEITLTDRRIRFRPGRGLETFIWRFNALDEPLSWVKTVRYSTIQRLLLIEGKSGAFHFGGPLIPKLYSSLRAMGVSEASTQILRKTERLDGLVAWEAQHIRKLIHHPGLLVAGPRNLSFTPQGRLDSVVGARNITIPLANLTRIEVSGLVDKRLVLESAMSTWAFALENPEAKLKILPPLMTQALIEDLEEGGEGALGFDALMEVWKDHLELDPAEPLLLTGPVLYWEQESAAVRGAVGITTKTVVFLPAAPPSEKTKHLQFPLEDITPMDTTDASGIHMETPEGELHFTPLTGEGFTEAFWMLSGQLTDDDLSFELEDTRSGQAALTRVLGELMYLCIFSDEHNLATMRPAFTLEHSEGLGIALEGCTDLALARDQEIVVEFAQPEGTYQFDARVIRTGPVPIALQRKRSKAHDLLVITAPTDLRFHNRRSGYRVHGFDQQKMNAVLISDLDDDTGKDIECFLEDLSIGGCGLNSHDFIPEEARLRLDLPLLENQYLPLMAVCCRSDPPAELGAPWEYGMQFVEMSNTARDRISQELLRRQREELSEKSLDDE